MRRTATRRTSTLTGASSKSSRSASPRPATTYLSSYHRVVEQHPGQFYPKNDLRREARWQEEAEDLRHGGIFSKRGGHHAGRVRGHAVRAAGEEEAIWAAVEARRRSRRPSTGASPCYRRRQMCCSKRCTLPQGRHPRQNLWRWSRASLWSASRRSKEPRRCAVLTVAFTAM